MKTSKTSIVRLAGGLALMAASSAAMSSVVNTAHNLGSQGNTSGMHFSGTTEVCIFCHTPHGGDIRTSAPIWNRAVSNSNVYTRFSNLGRWSFDAKEAPIGSVSIACLSCHDGTQARDSVINGSGSNSDGNVGGVGVTGSWMDGTNPTTGYLSSLQASDNGTVGDMIYLGTDLRNDHPISMQYAGGGIGTTGTTVDPDFAQVGTGTGGFGSTAPGHAATGSSNAGVTGSATGVVNTTTTQNTVTFWYVDTGTPGFQPTDFPLYTRSGVNGVDATNQPFVECATCHDPHSNNTTFLRLPGGNTGSQVCLTCHAK